MEVRHVLIEVEVDTNLTQDQLEGAVSKALQHSTASEAMFDALMSFDGELTFMGWYVKDKIPWPEPTSIYQSDGPEKMVTFDLNGHTIRVTPTKEAAVHSGRTRYHVECLTCGEVIHKATTGPRCLSKQHVKETR